MDLTFLVNQLAGNATRIEALVRGVSAEEASWKPDAEAWSILEVVNHLYDEEREDFRVRLDIILHQPEKQWPGIDPGGWVTQRKYNERDLGESLDNFLKEREKSLAWLRSIEYTDWNTAYEAPFGTMRAGDMFASWVTHDQLHMRQIVELHRALTEVRAKPYSLRYAGSW